MKASGNIDNAMEALKAAIAELDTRMSKGEHLDTEDVESLAELSTTTDILCNKAIIHFAESNSISDVANAFGLTPLEVELIVKSA